MADCQSDFSMSRYAVDYVFVRHPCQIVKKHLNMYQVIICARHPLGGRVVEMEGNGIIF